MLCMCRGLAAYGACLPAASRYEGEVAVLLRLLGIASQKLCDVLALTALLAAGSVCAFESERRAECLEAMAAVVAICEGPLKQEVVRALKGGSSIADDTLNPFAIEAALTLLEAAALHSSPPPPEIGHVIHVTGPCSWLTGESWVFSAVEAAMRGGLDVVASAAIQAGGCTRRKVVAVALLRQAICG